MKKILILLWLAIGISLSTKADTIDVWHVFYNAVKIKEFNAYGKHELTLKKDSLKLGDTITIKYFRDTQCSDCITHFTVEDEKHHVFVTSKGKGTFNPISFPIQKLLELKQQGYAQNFEVFYYEGELKSRTDKNLILKIKIE